MSTHVTEENTAADPTDCKSLTFQQLVGHLENQSVPPQLEDISSWLQVVNITDDDLQPFLGFKEGNYWRHRVCRNDSVEMLIICWRPGQKTPIHDHNGSHGVVRVHKGVLWESNFVFTEESGLSYRNGKERQAGELTGAAVPDIHQLGNPEISGQDLITIHVYAPPLGVLKTYKVGSAQVDLYTPNDFPS